MTEVKNEFIQKECEKERNPEKWAKFLNKHYSYVAKIDNYYLAIEKEEIKKSFCFGHGQNGKTTTEETHNACDMAQHARTSERYFLNENLQGINQKILNLKYFLLESEEEKEEYYKNHRNDLNYSIQFEKVYLQKTYTNKADFNSLSASDFERCSWLKNNIIRELTKDEIKKIVEMLEKEKLDFTKRLNTYLKRYGLSKIKSWTYLVD